MTPTTTPKHKYFEAVGRRKTAVARVRLTAGAKSGYDINGKTLEAYFPTKEMQVTAMEAITSAKAPEKFHLTAKVNGGGISAQADAVRLGAARALLVYDIEMRGKLKKLGFLKRDARAKERRKFGLKKARKAPQWSKR
jgi:small subunit ribosomal protein S9